MSMWEWGNKLLLKVMPRALKECQKGAKGF